MIKGYYPIAIRDFFSALRHLNRHFRILFSTAQSVQRDIRTTVPGADDLSEGEEAYFVSGSTYKKYVKLSGVIYSWDLTAV